MRLPVQVVAELAGLLQQPDPTDLVSPTGARRAHVRTQPGDPSRRLELLLNLSLALVAQLARPPGALEVS
jgi:hypothetical protein